MIRKKKILLKTKKLSDFFLRFPDNFSPYPTIKLLLTKNSFLRSLGRLFLAYDKLSSNFFTKYFMAQHPYFDLCLFEILQSSINTGSRLNIYENTYENKEEIRGTLSKFITNFIFKNQEKKKDRNPSILVIFPNQSIFFQIINNFFCLANKKFSKLSTQHVPKVSLPKILSKLKYGKGILPADNWNNFQDGAMDQINIYATIGEKHIKISKTFLNSDIFFTPPLALKKKKRLDDFFENINLCWIDSLEMILYQNIENFLFIIKHLIRLRIKICHSAKLNFKKKKLIFKIYIFSSLLPSFLVEIFNNLSFSNVFFFKQLKKSFTHGITTHPGDCPKEPHNLKKSGFLVIPKILKLDVMSLLQNNTKTNLLIFTRNYSDLIPIRNRLQKIKKNIKLKINIFSEYNIGEKKKYSDTSLTNINIINLTTERYFHHLRILNVRFDTVYFYNYPYNKELYYEIVQQSNFKM